MAAIFWKFKLFDVALIWPQIRNLRPKLVELDHFEPPLFIFWRLFITCQNFEEICKYVRLTVCMSVCLFVCLFVTRYRSQFLTNHHQNSSTHVVCLREEPYSFYRSEVKQLGHEVKK